jgi:hypothetical protein
MSPAAQLSALADTLGARVQGAPDHAALLLGLASLDADEAAKAAEAGQELGPLLLALEVDANRLRWDGERLGLADGLGLSAMIRAALA